MPFHRTSTLHALLALGLASLTLNACSSAGQDAPRVNDSADPAASGEPRLIDPAELSGRLIVNGAFADPDAAIGFPDGSTLVIHVDASGVTAVAETRPIGTASVLDIVEEMGIEASLALLAPNIDFRPILARIAEKQLPAPQDQVDVAAGTLRPEVWDWLESKSLLESFLAADEQMLAAENTPIRPLSHNCINWDWFVDDFWGGGTYNFHANCDDQFIYKHSGYKNCKFATMNDQGPGEVNYIYQYRKSYVGTSYSGTYINDLEPYTATGITFTKLVDFWVVQAFCQTTNVANTGTDLHALSKRWD